ncbi:MAG: hypothetical protein U5K55_01515 [Aliarcobacter sp.]|nr:hypothetical protein [Aliarcobacter sp.]
MALNGNKKVYSVSNAKKVTKYMIEVIFGNSFSENYEWKNLIYKMGLKDDKL